MVSLTSRAVILFLFFLPPFLDMSLIRVGKFINRHSGDTTVFEFERGQITLHCDQFSFNALALGVVKCSGLNG